MLSIEVATVRPKKNGNPQSKPGMVGSVGKPGMGPARLSNTEFLPFRLAVLATAKVTLVLSPPLAERVALRLTVELGQ